MSSGSRRQVVQRRSALLTSETPHSTLDGCVRNPTPKYFGRTTRDAAPWVAGILQEVDSGPTAMFLAIAVAALVAAVAVAFAWRGDRVL